MKRKMIQLFLVGTLMLITLACSVLSNVSQQIGEIEGTAQSVITQARGMATQAGPFLLTVQALSTQNPGILETVQAIATQSAPMLSTLQAVATDNPGLMQTVQAAITQNLGSGSAPEDIALVEQSLMQNFFGSEQLVTYTTSLVYVDVLSFYKTQMNAKGWEAVASSTYELSNAAILTFNKTDRSATVSLTINPIDHSTVVIISINPR
jgi:hypothetical protein